MARRLYPHLALVPVRVEDTPPEPEPENFIVQGKHASKPEFHVARGLEILGFDYVFQVSLLGGRRLPGGIVLDFQVETVPLPTPIPVQSRYYHVGRQRTLDILQQILIDRIFGGQIAKPVEIWDDEVPTITDAVRILRQRLL